MPALDDLKRGITSGDRIISPIEAAVSSTKKEERRAVGMTYLVSAMGFLVGMVVISIAMPGSTDPHIALPAITLSGGIVFFFCRLFCGKIWIRPAKDKRAEVEILKSEWALSDRPDERKSLEEKLLKLSGNLAYFAMSQSEYASKLKDLKKREERAYTPKERQKLEEFENQLKGGLLLLFRLNSPIAVSFLASILAAFFLCTQVHPFQHFDSVVHVGLICLLPICIFTFLLVRRYPVWPYMRGLPGDEEKPLVELYLARLMSSFALTLLLSCLVLWLNQSLDHSVANSYTLMILDKKFSISTDSKTGNTSEKCFVYIRSPGQSPTAGNIEQIEISPQDYERAIPQQTKITIDVANGFFHLPWYSNSYSLSEK